MSKLSPPSARPLLPTGLIQRETGDVSELPPPVPPPPADAASAAPTGGWDWDRARELAEQWFRPLLEKDGWLALAYLSVGAISAALLFAGMLLFGMMTLGLVFAIVGILLIVPFVSHSWSKRLQRRRGSSSNFANCVRSRATDLDRHCARLPIRIVGAKSHSWHRMF